MIHDEIVADNASLYDRKGYAPLKFTAAERRQAMQAADHLSTALQQYEELQETFLRKVAQAVAAGPAARALGSSLSMKGRALASGLSMKGQALLSSLSMKGHALSSSRSTRAGD